jgi:hypothetical protein
VRPSTSTSPDSRPDGSIAAVEKYPCAACGAQAEWNPSRQMLVCSFCGTAAPFSVDDKTGALIEHDLVKALREVPDAERGWLEAKRTVQCQSCKAVSVFDPARVGQNCEFCGSPKLLDYNEIRAPIRPQGILPFKVDQGKVREQIRGWFATKWIAPSDLKRRGMVDRVQGVYIPYWTFDAQVVCPWEADAGHYYYTTEEYRDSQGKVQTRQVRHTRWTPASGQIEHYFDDVPVAGTHGVHTHLLRQVEPFATKELVGYETAYLSGFVVEHYQVVLFDAAEQSQQSMHDQLTQMCAAEVPGDTYRNLRIHPSYSGQTFKHVLVPIWMLTYNYGPKVFQVIVNGYSGKMAGEYPKSIWKILLLIFVVLVVALIAAMLSDQ